MILLALIIIGLTLRRPVVGVRGNSQAEPGTAEAPWFGDEWGSAAPGHHRISRTLN